MTDTSLIEYPCNFTIKIMGNNTATFLKEIKEIVVKHFPNTVDGAITYNLSKNNNYLAITATVYAENQTMLDDFYRDITKHPDVKMAL